MDTNKQLDVDQLQTSEYRKTRRGWGGDFAQLCYTFAYRYKINIEHGILIGEKTPSKQQIFYYLRKLRKCWYNLFERSPY